MLIDTIHNMSFYYEPILNAKLIATSEHNESRDRMIRLQL